MDEYSVQSPGFISRLKNRLSQIDQRTALDAFIVLLILIGLAASVFLAGQRQIFRSRASQNGSADVVNEQGQALPKNEDGSVNVETQQIRLKIDFPTDWSQSLLPGLINPAYAQETPQCLDQNQLRCQGTTCINATYYEGSTPVRDGSESGCYQCTPSCSSETVTQPTPAPTSPFQQTCTGAGYQCASPDAHERGVTQSGFLCGSYLSNSAFDRSCVNMGTGYSYCYTDCRQPQATPTPAQLGPTLPPAVQQPTAPPPQTTTAPAVGGRPPQTPTATPEPEQTLYIQVSLKQDKLGKDKCTSSADPNDHCLQFNLTNEESRYFFEQGQLVDWWLPNEPKTYTIYIGFVSNKGGLKSAPPVKVAYRPKQATPTGRPEDITLKKQPIVSSPENSRPDNFQKSIIGNSVQQRPIEVFRFGTGPIKIVAIGGLHTGNESNTAELAKAMINYFNKNYSEIPSQVSLYIIPIANPDGYYNKSHKNANNVDLNRNWKTKDWKSQAIHTGLTVNGGSSPLSEPETSSLYSFLTSLRPDLTFVWHSRGALVEDNNIGDADNLTGIYARNSGYKQIEKWTAYPITGQFIDSMAEVGIPAFDAELTNYQNTDFDRNLKGLKAMMNFITSSD